MHMCRIWPLGILWVVLALAFQAPAAAQEDTRAFFKILEQRLVADGFDAGRIKALYQNEDVFFESKGVSLYFLHNEATLDYSKMTKSPWIREGLVYMKKHGEVLQ